MKLLNPIVGNRMIFNGDMRLLDIGPLSLYIPSLKSHLRILIIASQGVLFSCIILSIRLNFVLLIWHPKCP